VTGWEIDMFGMSGMKFAIMGILASAVVTAVGLGYWHYTGLLSKVAILQANNAKLETAIQVQKSTITVQADALEEWQDSQAKLLKTVEDLVEVNRTATTETRRLQNVFSRHDLNALAQRKPTLVETRINRGTADIGRLLECATGAGGSDC